MCLTALIYKDIYAFQTWHSFCD